ncbi:MAG: ABC transporter ATP-binding protein, partial [Planctomycetota bacterium]
LESLSGGEAQRVMIARALAQQPTLCLLDEPTSHLDIASEMTIYRMMQRLAHDWNMAVICVSHDVNLAARFADRLVVMRDGQVLGDGPAERIIQPELIEAAYDVKVQLIDLPDQPVPLIRVVDVSMDS